MFTYRIHQEQDTDGKESGGLQLHGRGTGIDTHEPKYRGQTCDRERRHSMGLLSPKLTTGTRQAWQRRQGFYRYPGLTIGNIVLRGYQWYNILVGW